MAEVSGGYIVPPVWLLPDLTVHARPVRRVWLEVPVPPDWPAVPGCPPPNMEACLDCRRWHTLQQYGGPGLFDWMRVCPSCGFWWRRRN